MTANRDMALRVVWATRADDRTPAPDARELLEMCGLVEPGGHEIAPEIVAGLPVGGHVGKVPTKANPSTPYAMAQSDRRPENCTTPPGLRELPPLPNTRAPAKKKRRRGLQAELDELERTDPDVAAAAASYDRMVERITGRTMPARGEAERLTAAGVNPATAAILAAGPPPRSAS